MTDDAFIAIAFVILLIGIAGTSRLRKTARERDERNADPRIRLTEDGFVIEPPIGDGPRLSILWNDVHTVHAFKRDLFTTDLICLLIAYGDGEVAQIHEKMPGWPAFTKTLDQHLPGAQPYAEWYLAAMSPAFETNARQIYIAETAV